MQEKEIIYLVMLFMFWIALVCIIIGFEITLAVREIHLKATTEGEIWYEVDGSEIYLYGEDFRVHLLLTTHRVFGIDVKLF